MARIGSLLVNLALEDAAFINGLKRATKETEQAMSRMNRAATMAGSAFKASIAGISFAAITGLGRQVMQFADDMQTAADRAGLGVESYQRMGQALRALEIDTAQFNKTTEKLVLTLGDVQAGTAAQGVTAALSRMGIESDVLNGRIKQTDELFLRIAESAKRYATEQQFAADVSAIVGDKIGPKLAASIRDGGEAYKQLAANVGIATAEQVKRLADANEAIDSFVEKIQTSTVIVGGTTLKVVDNVTAGIKRMVAEALRETDRLIGVQDKVKALPPAAVTKQRDMDAINALPAGSDVRRSLESAFLKKYGALPEAVAEEIVVTAAKLPKAPGAGNVMKAAIAASKELSDAMKRMEQSAGGAGVLEGAGPLDETANRLREIQQIAIDIPPIKPINLEALELAEDFQRNLVQGLGQAIVYGRSLGDALVGSIQAAAAQLVTSGLLNLLNGAGSGGGGFLSTIGTAIGGVFGGARANGGPVSAGRAYLVGEKGPEILFPGMSGTIASNRKSFGGGAVINVDARGATDPAAVEQAALTAFLAARRYTDAAFDSRGRVRLARGAGAA